MAFLPSSLLLLIYASSQLPQAGLAFPYPRRGTNSFQLSSQLTNFIPTCAQPCFISFLDVNFNTSRLGIFPDLDTLCSQNSSSGYTIGEGAVECIIGEDDAGGCSKTGVGGDDGSGLVVQRAFDMCVGQRGALPNTHATLVATLFTSGSAVLVAPNPTVSPSITIKTSASPTSSQSLTSSVPRTITASSTTVPSTVPLTTATGSPTPILSTSISPSVTAPTTALPASTTAAAISSSTAPAKSLPTSKIVGISVGTVGGVAAVVGLTVFLYFLRKRRNRDRDSDLFPFTPESSNSLAARRFTEYSRRHGQVEKAQESPGLFAPGGTRNGVAAKISPTFHPRNESPPPSNEPTIRLVDDRDPRLAMRASSIGLAISAEPSPATLIPSRNPNDGRHSSKLLPEKPTLALQIPKETYSRPGQVFNFPSPPRSQNSSIMNRGRPKINFGPPLATFSDSSNSNQASRKGSDSEYGKGERSNTLSTNFQPYLQNTPYYPENVNTPYEQNMALRKYLASDQNMHVRPLEIRRSAQQQPTQFGGGYNPSNDRAYGYSNPTRLPNTYQTGSIPRQNSNRGPKNNYNAYQRPTQRPGRESTGSVTSFESFESGDEVELTSPGGTVTIASRKSNGGMDRQKSRTMELSPVKESPSPGTPVSYPKIPGRLGTTVRMIPPPPRPDFTKVMGSGSLPRKPVPMPSNVQATSNPYAGEKPWRQAELAAAAMRRSARGSIYNTNQSPRDTMAPSAIYNTLPSQRRPVSQNQSYLQPNQETGGDRISTASTNSSLLAKRRGDKLAAGLTLRGPSATDDSITQNYGSSPNSKWRVLRDEEIREAKSPGWRPQVGRQGQASQNPYRMSRDVFLDDGGLGSGKENYGQGQKQTQEVPGTPGWKPRLTPTRRGDELFLSVQ